MFAGLATALQIAVLVGAIALLKAESLGMSFNSTYIQPTISSATAPTSLLILPSSKPVMTSERITSTFIITPLPASTLTEITPLPASTISTIPAPSNTPQVTVTPSTPVDPHIGITSLPASSMFNDRQKTSLNSLPLSTVVPSPTPSSTFRDTIASTTQFSVNPATSPLTSSATPSDVFPTTHKDSSTLTPDDKEDDVSQLPLAGVIGIAIGATVTIASLSLTVVLLICFCCCCLHSKKYEYNTGNEHRMTVQQWNITSAHFNMNRVGSMSSIGSSRSSHSRGSSLFGSFGFTRRYSNSADHVTCIINQPVPDLYSTPV